MQKIQGRAEFEIEFMESSLSEEYASRRHFSLFGFVDLLAGEGAWILLSGKRWPGDARALCAGPGSWPSSKLVYLPEPLAPINRNSISCPWTTSQAHLVTEPNADLSFASSLEILSAPTGIAGTAGPGRWTPRSLPGIGSFKRPLPVGLGRRTSCSVVLGPDSSQMSVCV